LASLESILASFESINSCLTRRSNEAIGDSGETSDDVRDFSVLRYSVKDYAIHGVVSTAECAIDEVVVAVEFTGVGVTRPVSSLSLKNRLNSRPNSLMSLANVRLSRA
jgi:hypothetical protein